jgi:hypothetical protein
MARRLLIAATSLVLAGCPHDWAAFERVPEASGAETDTSSAQPSPAPTAGTSDPVVFAEPSSEHPTLIVADGEGIVFVTREGSVMACPHAGCTPILRLASAQRDVRSIAASGAFAAWTANGENAVRRTTRKPGGAIDEVYEDDGLLAVGVTASKVYWSVRADFPFGAPQIRTCSPGIDCDDIMPGLLADGIVTDLVIDGSDAYWIESGRLLGCPLAACEDDANKKRVLAAEPLQAVGLAADSANVYFLTSEGGGTVRAVPRAGGAARTIATGVGTDARIAVTTQSVWVTSPSAARVVRAPIAGGALTVVAEKLAEPFGIAAGGDGVYVACAGNGRILRWGAE